MAQMYSNLKGTFIRSIQIQKNFVRYLGAEIKTKQYVVSDIKDRTECLTISEIFDILETILSLLGQ